MTKDDALRIALNALLGCTYDERMRAIGAVKEALPMLPVLLLTACASNSPRPEGLCPRIPSPPSLTTLQPQQMYSESARQNISGWQKRLTDTLPTRRP